MLACQEQLDDIVALLERNQANEETGNSSLESIHELEILCELFLQKLKAADHLFNNLIRGSSIINNLHPKSSPVKSLELRIVLKLPYDAVMEDVPNKTLVRLRTTREAWIKKSPWVKPFHRGYYLNGRIFWSWFSDGLSKINDAELIVEEDKSFKVACKRLQCSCGLYRRCICSCQKSSVEMILKSTHRLINMDIVPVIQLTQEGVNPGLRYFIPNWNRQFEFSASFGPLYLTEVLQNSNKFLQKLLLLIKAREFLTEREHACRFESSLFYQISQNSPEKLWNKPIFDILEEILKLLSNDFGEEYKKILTELNIIRENVDFCDELCTMFHI